MRLYQFLKIHKVRPTVFGKENGIPASVICRYLKGGEISPINAIKIVAACGGKVTLDDIYADLRRKVLNLN